MRIVPPPPASVSYRCFECSGDGRSTRHAGRPPSIQFLSTLLGRKSMSKELVISANRHETRVAIIEDDQVVEVYHQRENEYSLAGSIHKGRVTRVLPGMQSAFVDIGLERDAFLYVSDFFEDNEEYDKIVTSVEEKVLKLDRNPRAGTPPAVPAVGAAAEEPATGVPVEAVPDVPVEGVAPAPPVAAGSPPSTSPEGAPAEHRRDERDREGRGRSGRRRRGPRGRGLPESKFYSPGSGGRPEHQPHTESRPEAAAAEPAGEPALSGEVEDLFVLPGETLAKYRGESSSEVRTAEPLLEEENAADN